MCGLRVAVRRSVCLIVLVAFIATSVNLGLVGLANAQAPAQPTAAADYRVGPGDHIFLSVPQRSDLNRDLVVGADGRVELPLIGKVDINGLVATEIETRLLQALRDYYPSIQRVQVTITQAISQGIYVSGQVRNPGKYTFPAVPNVWEVIREAGGPVAGAALSSVRIVKDRSRGGTSVLVNVLAAIEGGSVETLPLLEGGDTVIVPSQDESYTGAYGVNISGSVKTPGVYRLEARQDLMSAILLAGGPVEAADVKKIRIIRPRSDGTVTTIAINLEDFLYRGDPFANPKLLPGDTVHLPRRGQFNQLLTSDIRGLLSVTTATLSAVVLIVSLQNK